MQARKHAIPIQSYQKTKLSKHPLFPAIFYVVLSYATSTHSRPAPSRPLILHPEVPPPPSSPSPSPPSHQESYPSPSSTLFTSPFLPIPAHRRVNGVQRMRRIEVHRVKMSNTYWSILTCCTPHPQPQINFPGDRRGEFLSLVLFIPPSSSDLLKFSTSSFARAARLGAGGLSCSFFFFFQG